jgi:hypothetical protein
MLVLTSWKSVSGTRRCMRTSSRPCSMRT